VILVSNTLAVSRCNSG